LLLDGLLLIEIDQRPAAGDARADLPGERDRCPSYQAPQPDHDGKVERFHQTLERELLEDVEVWPDVAAVQAAVDAFRIEYNTSRPLQSLEMAFPAEGARPAGPPPQPAAEPVQVERRVSCRGAITIARQRIHIGIVHAGRTLTVESADHTFRIYDGDQLLAETGRTTTKPIARFKVRKPEPPRQRHPAQGSAIWH
jgi:hypothetical protein